jgi:dUTPase
MTLYICPTDDSVRGLIQSQLAVHRYTDSGFDIPMKTFNAPVFTHSYSFNLGIRVAAVDASGNPMPCLLLPRSSIYKTRFRMANSIGLIDSGYRGEVQAKVDVVYKPPPLETGEIGTRLFQICQHNFLPWKRIVIVPSLTELPTFSDTRGDGGFGSTGNTTSYDSLSSHLHCDGGVGLGYVP